MLGTVIELQQMARSMALSHHPETHLDRCTVIAGHHVCRRCLVLYPIAFFVLALDLLGVFSLAPQWLMILPSFAAAEFVLEMCGVIGYSAKRQVIATAIAAPALGSGFVRVLSNVSDGSFWRMVFTFAGPAAFAALWRGMRNARNEEATRIADEEAHPLLQGFASAADFQRYLDSAPAES